MKKALFLDRDGIINVDHGYVYKIEEFEFMPKIFDLCKLAVEKGYLIIVITNQSGIGRGKYTELDFEKLTKWMNEQFSINSIYITDVFYCPHHPEKAIDHYLKTCDCRKPAPGLINQAVSKYQIDVNKSVFIGDKQSDMLAAESAGVKTRVLFSNNTSNNKNLYSIVVSDLEQIRTIFV